MSVYGELVTLGRRPDRPLASGLVPSARAERANPFCGDDIALEVVLDDRGIRAVGYRAHGCVFVRASASLLVDQTVGLTTDQALVLARALDKAIRTLGRFPSGLEELAGVKYLPVRRQCALLPWEALTASLAERAA